MLVHHAAPERPGTGQSRTVPESGHGHRSGRMRSCMAHVLETTRPWRTLPPGPRSTDSSAMPLHERLGSPPCARASPSRFLRITSWGMNVMGGASGGRGKGRKSPLKRVVFSPSPGPPPPPFLQTFCVPHPRGGRVKESCFAVKKSIVGLFLFCAGEVQFGHRRRGGRLPRSGRSPGWPSPGP